jgi:hypothetical protein
MYPSCKIAPQPAADMKKTSPPAELLISVLYTKNQLNAIGGAAGIY